MKKSLPVLILSLFSLLFYHCATTGPGGKKAVIFISTEQEVSIGKQMAGEVAKEYKTLPDTVVQNYVSRVGQKLVQVSDRKDLEYHFTVIDSKEINAFAMPGGYIYIYTGLLKLMESEAELAGVLGHEVGHIVARHGVRRLQQVIGLNILLDIALGKSSEAVKQGVSVGIGLMLQGFSRENELEADYDAIFYMSRASYNPHGMVDLLKKLDNLDKSGKNVIEKLAADHPPTIRRIEFAQQSLDSLGYANSTLPVMAEDYKKMKERLK